MTAITRIDPPIEVETPRGRGVAIFLLDYSTDSNLMWIVNMKDTGECWTFRNPEIRFVWCETTGTGRRPGVPLPWDEIGQIVPVTESELQRQRLMGNFDWLRSSEEMPPRPPYPPDANK